MNPIACLVLGDAASKHKSVARQCAKLHPTHNDAPLTFRAVSARTLRTGQHLDAVIVCCFVGDEHSCYHARSILATLDFVHQRNATLPVVVAVNFAKLRDYPSAKQSDEYARDLAKRANAALVVVDTSAGSGIVDLVDALCDELRNCPQQFDRRRIGLLPRQRRPPSRYRERKVKRNGSDSTYTEMVRLDEESIIELDEASGAPQSACCVLL